MKNKTATIFIIIIVALFAFFMLKESNNASASEKKIQEEKINFILKINRIFINLIQIFLLKFKILLFQDLMNILKLWGNIFLKFPL